MKKSGVAIPVLVALVVGVSESFGGWDLWGVAPRPSYYPCIDHVYRKMTVR